MFHPDSNQDTADHEEIIKINAAYEVLSDVEQRVKYDEQIGNTSHPRTGNRENPLGYTEETRVAGRFIRNKQSGSPDGRLRSGRRAHSKIRHSLYHLCN